MAVDVSRIPNNNKFDPVREAILQLQSDVQSGVSGVGSVNGQDGLITITNSGNITVSTVGTTITIGINDSTYLTEELNDLTAAVTWANVPDANITQSSVTQHQAALSITESQISDLQSYLVASDLDDYLLLTETGTQTIAGSIVISGDLTISGTTTYINTNHLNIGDNIIQLNADIGGTTAPTEDAGFYVNRGSSPDASFLWDEQDDRFSTYANALATASLYIGSNQVINASRQFIGSSTISSTVPYFTFSGDTNTGVGRATNNMVSLIADGTKVLEANNTGVDITGTLDVSGSITGNGIVLTDDIITSASFTTASNRFKLILTQADAGTIEASLDDVVLSSAMDANYVPYVTTAGGDGSSTNTNAVLSESWLKINSNTLELDWTISGSPGYYQERNIKMRKQGSFVNQYKEATYDATSITFTDYVSASDIDTATISGTNAGRIRINDTYSLPAGDGSSGQVLGTNGSGDLSWVSGAATTSDLQDVTDNGNSTSNSITINNSTDDRGLDVYYTDGSYTAVRGYGILFDRGTTYLRPTADASKNLYVGGFAADFDWLNIYVKYNTSIVWSQNGTSALSLDSSRNLSIESGNLEMAGTTVIDSSRNLYAGSGTFTGNISFSNISYKIIFGSGGTNPSWGAPQIARIGTYLTMSDYSGVELGGYNGTAYGARFRVSGNGNVNVLEGDLQMGGTTVIDSSRNITATSGTFQASGTGGSTTVSIQHAGTTGSGILDLQSASAPSVIQSDTDLQFKTSGSARLHIEDTGNVGVNTTSPSSQLQVDGDFNISNKYIYNEGTIATTGAGVANGSALTWKKNTTAINTAYNYRVRLTTSGTGTNSGATYLVEYDPDTTTYNVRMVSRSGSNSNHPLLAMSGSQMIAYTNHATAYNIQYHTEAISVADNDGTLHNMGADYHWQRDVNNLFYEDGNVGIGTTSPAYKLTVSSSNATYGIDGDSSGNVYHYSTSGEHRFRANGGTTNAFVINNSLISTNKTAYFASNVGIGTTTPGNKLNIYSNDANTNPLIRLENNGTGDAAMTFVKTGVHGWTIGLDNSDGYKFKLSNSSGDVGGGTAAITVDTSFRVGIGTTTPQAPLHIIAASTASDALLQEWSYTQSNQDVYSLMLKQTVTSGVVRYNFSMVNNSTAYNDVLVLDRGNVGIGTTSPSQKLTVAGSINLLNVSTSIPTAAITHYTNNYLYIKGGSSGAAMGNSSFGSAFYAPSDNTLNFVAGTSERMRITSAGNVGIGTTSPTAKLTINGGVNNVWSYSTATTDQAGFVAADNVDYASHTNLLYNKIYGSGITATAFGQTLGNWAVTASSGSSNNGLLVGTFSNKPVIIGTNSAARMTITNTGNVGIGTTSPQTKLHIEGLTRITEGGNTAFYSGNYVRLFNSQAFQFRNSAGSSISQINLSGNSYFNGGNVGIGTTSPISKLHIDSGGNSSGFRLHGTNTSYTGMFISNSNGGASRVYMDASNGDFSGSDYSWIGHNDDLTFEVATSPLSGDILFKPGSSERVRFTKDGNVGIGTTSPNAQLHVYSSGNGEIEVERASGALINLQAQSAVGVIGTDSNHPLYFKTNAGTRVAINTNGRVGIGNTSPSQLLDVSGIGIFGGTYRASLDGNSAGAYLRFGVDADIDSLGTIGTYGSAMMYETAQSLGHIFKTGAGLNGTERLRINSSGDVGIGTNSPTERLQVAGNIRAEAFGAEGSTFTRVYAPEGATYNGASSNTGMLTIILPQIGLNTMLKMTIRVFDYANNESFDVYVAGYLYGNPNTQWTRCQAHILCDPQIDRNFTVRFGKDSNGKGCVFIGETTSTWSYVKFGIVDAQFSHSQTALANWIDGYNATVLNDLTGYTVYTSVSNTQATNWKRNGQNLYYGSGSGNVGIGTTSPQFKLDVGDSINATNGYKINGINVLFASATYMQLYNTEGAVGIYIGDSADRSNYYDNNYHYFRTAGGLSTLGVWNSVGLGVGTSTPAVRLDVRDTSTSATQINLENNSTGGGAYRLQSTGSTASIGAGKFSIYSVAGSSHRFIIDSSGNVGIGTAAPAQELHVQGSIQYTGTIVANTVQTRDKIRVWNSNTYAIGMDYQYTFGHLNDYAMTFQMSNTAARGFWWGDQAHTNAQGAMSLTTQGKLTVATSLNVGYGESVTSPSETNTLMVNGSVGADNIISSADFSVASNRFKLVLTTQDSNTIEASLDDVVLSNQLDSGFVPYTTTSGGDTTTTNAYLSDSFLKIVGSTLQLDWGDTVGVYTERNLTMRKDGGGFGQYYESDYQAGQITFTHYDSSGIDTASINSTSNGSLELNADANINLKTAGSSRFYIDSSGNIGVNDSTPSYKLDVNGTSRFVSSVGINSAPDTGSAGSYLKIQGGSTGFKAFRILGGAYSSIGEFEFGYNGAGVTVINNAGYNSAGMSFKYGTSTVGSISINSASTSYNTTSDYRLKENVAPISDGIDRLKQLKPSRFNFIGHEEVVDGFIAHEAQTVVPEAVSGEKDAVDFEGKPDYQGIDQSKLVPLLTAALQEAVAKIEALEQRISNLENQ